MNKKGLLIGCTLLVALSAHAELYQTNGPDGQVSYSDVPSSGAIEVNAPPVNEVPSTLPDAQPAKSQPVTSPASGRLQQSADKAKQRLPYTVFEFDSPKNQESIQNQPVFPVKFKIMPALQAGDKIQVMLDGNAYGSPQASPTITLSNIDRGTHQLSAYIVDNSMQIMKRTDTITIYVHRASRLNTAGRHRVMPATELTFPIQTLIKKTQALIIQALS